MEFRLVADTNLFLECKALDQLPWSELGADPIVVVLTKPVLDEIDKHKKSTGRTRARALEIFGRVREMVTAGTIEIDIRTSSPRVMLRLATNARPDPALRDDLDYSKTDERLIGIVATLNADGSDSPTRLFTDDIGPASMAQGLNVPHLLIDPAWRRPAAESTEQRRIGQLERDLETYRSQEPMIAIGICEGASPENVIGIEDRIAAPLTPEQIEALLDELRRRRPPIQECEPPEPKRERRASGDVATTRYSAPSEDDIAEYRGRQYPAWIESCRQTLATLHQGRDELTVSVPIRWPISNEGTRPATRVRIEFEGKGAVKLVRGRTVEDTDEDQPSADASQPVRPRFPPPPTPPPFRTEVSIKKGPLVPAHGSVAAALRASALVAQHADRIAAVGKLQGLTHSALGADLLRGYASSDLASRLASRAPSISDLLPLSVHPPEVYMPQLPEPDDPESFYYDWPLELPVRQGALTCELWRHKNREKVFDFEARLTGDGASRAAVECTVHADNLTAPAKGRVVIAKTVRSKDMMSLARELIEAVG